ncbi:Protein of unknown function DUF674 [Dillenia turbinata]|uniref:Uncharacterized protein n=1 Tax=Dillenia turbinata TaxID=194707 RepID=A0AAN8ZGN0_9MAGN
MNNIALMAPNQVELKPFIDTKTKKLLFAEAGKDFVDFLFNLQVLPFATVIRLLSKRNDWLIRHIILCHEVYGGILVEQSRFNVKDVGAIEENVVKLGLDEDFKLLVEASEFKVNCPMYYFEGRLHMTSNTLFNTSSSIIYQKEVKRQVLNPRKAHAQIYSEDHVLRTLLNFNQKQENNSKESITLHHLTQQ